MVGEVISISEPSPSLRDSPDSHYLATSKDLPLEVTGYASTTQASTGKWKSNFLQLYIPSTLSGFRT